MRSEKGGVVPSILLWVAGTLITIVVFTGIIWPWLLSLWYGSCWADARSDIRELGSEIEGSLRGPGRSADFRLNIGSCIAGVVFINGGVNSEYKNVIADACEDYDGYKSYIIVIPEEFLIAQKDPSFTEKMTKTINDIKSTLSVWDKISLFVKDKMGRVPPTYCYELEHGFSTEYSIPEDYPDSWNKGGEPLCLRVSTTSLGESDYNYRIEEIQCKVEEKDE